MQSLIRILGHTFIPAVLALIGSKTISAFLIPPTAATASIECDYVLPFPAYLGDVTVSQGNGSYYHWGSHQQESSSEYAFDFDLEAGDIVLAAREGIVVDKHDGETSCGDKSYLDNANYVIVEHEDGTFAQYTHLEPGIPVEEGQEVHAGRTRIGDAGNTGWTNCGNSPGNGFHLHFQVQEGMSKTSQSLPICFIDVPGDGVPIMGAAYLSKNEAFPCIDCTSSENLGQN